MKYLVDANVLSEPTKSEPSARVMEWLARHERELVVNPIVLGELEFGILKLAGGRRKSRLSEWFKQAPRRLRVLEIDHDTARVWAGLLASLSRKGRTMPVTDSLIAATALQYHLAVATRNLRDYAHAGVQVVDPFAA